MTIKPLHGPNFCWHMDGNDKILPNGFAIHGCIIDGLCCDVLYIHEQIFSKGIVARSVYHK